MFKKKEFDHFKDTFKKLLDDLAASDLNGAHKFLALFGMKMMVRQGLSSFRGLKDYKKYIYEAQIGYAESFKERLESDEFDEHEKEWIREEFKEELDLLKEKV